jgi:hypothetical protein
LKYVAIPKPTTEKEVRLNNTQNLNDGNIIPQRKKSNDSNNPSSDEEEEKNGNCPLQAAFDNGKHEIMEILLRNMTLQSALRADNSSENDEIDPKYENLLRSFYTGERDDHPFMPQEKRKIKRLLTTRSDNVQESQRLLSILEKNNLESSMNSRSIDEDSCDDDAYFIKNSEGYKIEIITDEMKAIKFGQNDGTTSNRITQEIVEKSTGFNNKSKIKKSSSSNNKQIDSLVENHFFDTKSKLSNKKNRLRSLKG